MTQFKEEMCKCKQRDRERERESTKTIDLRVLCLVIQNA